MKFLEYQTWYDKATSLALSATTPKSGFIWGGEGWLFWVQGDTLLIVSPSALINALTMAFSISLTVYWSLALTPTWIEQCTKQHSLEDNIPSLESDSLRLISDTANYQLYDLGQMTSLHLVKWIDTPLPKCYCEDWDHVCKQMTLS